MVSPEKPKQIELKTFGGAVGRAAVDVQKSLLESGHVDEAVGFNLRLARSIDDGHTHLNLTLEIMDKLANTNIKGEALARQLKLAERFIMRFPQLRSRLEEMFEAYLRENLPQNKHDEKGLVKSLKKRFREARALGVGVGIDRNHDYTVSIPKPPYSPVSAIEIAWGNPSNVAARKLGVIRDGHTLEETLRDSTSVHPSSLLVSATRHGEIQALAGQGSGSSKPKFFLLIPTPLLLSVARHDIEVVRI